MATYAVACTLQIPVEHDEPREVSAIASIEVDHQSEQGPWLALELDAAGSSMLNMPTDHPVYLKSYVAIIPTPGPTQLEIDAELRLALGEHGWTVL